MWLSCRTGSGTCLLREDQGEVEGAQLWESTATLPCKTKWFACKACWESLKLLERVLEPDYKQWISSLLYSSLHPALSSSPRLLPPAPISTEGFSKSCFVPPSFTASVQRLQTVPSSSVTPMHTDFAFKALTDRKQQSTLKCVEWKHNILTQLFYCTTQGWETHSKSTPCFFNDNENSVFLSVSEHHWFNLTVLRHKTKINEGKITLHIISVFSSLSLFASMTHHPDCGYLVLQHWDTHTHTHQPSPIQGMCLISMRVIFTVYKTVNCPPVSLTRLSRWANEVG